jgi:hypothetical protein
VKERYLIAVCITMKRSLEQVLYHRLAFVVAGWYTCRLVWWRLYMSGFVYILYVMFIKAGRHRSDESSNAI